MLSFNLDSKESAEKLIRLCEKYRDDVEVDVICGRQTVDGRSLLGVISLIGHFVTVKPNGKDENAVQRFSKELERLKC
mgnify:CR=1 FL=1